MKPRKTKRQSSQYDKIFKENIEAVIPSLMENVLGIKAVESEELPDDIQHTKERKPDVLKKITDTKGDTFVLHLEFQVVDEPDMVHRMHEYKAMLLRKYKIPVHQHVIFLGKNAAKMSTELQTINLYFKYNLLEISTINYTTFLKSNHPEEIILAVLADFNKETSENALKKIISRLEGTTKSDLALKRYFKQLRILSQLRKLEQKLKDIIMENITKYIDEKRDVGFMIGQEKAQIKFVTFLLQDDNRTFDQIADITGVSVEFVKTVQQKLAIKK
jgi:hypothetical protein